MSSEPVKEAFAYKHVAKGDVELLRQFLTDVDLTLAGLDAPTVRLWVEYDDFGSILGSTGYEVSEDGEHVLIRSVEPAGIGEMVVAGFRCSGSRFRRRPTTARADSTGVRHRKPRRQSAESAPRARRVRGCFR